MARTGDTILFRQPPVVRAWASVAGKKESKGPLGAQFDLRLQDNRLGQKTWEQAESELQRRCAALCLKKTALPAERIDLALGGDLQAQCTATGYAMRQLGVPFAGLYGACSTMAESMALAACLCAGDFVGNALAMSSSHFCAAERQFRTPLEYGGQRTPSAQWTATGAGCCLLSPAGAGVAVRAVTFGRVCDLNITDINNMGAAMAPAAVQTIRRHLTAMGAEPEQYDAIYTGDLGQVGSRLLHQLLAEEGIRLVNHKDCGLLLYDVEHQRVRAGGSGAGCSALVLCAHVLPALAAGKMKRVLFLSTGALMSQTTFLQGESIPGIAHAIELEGGSAT